MSIRQISSAEEEKLINNVKKAIDMANNGENPSKAIAKVAEDNCYNTDFVERMTAMFNTSKTLSHLSKSAGAERAADFDTASAEEAIAVMLANTSEKKSSNVGEIISGKDLMKISTVATLEKAASAAISPYSKDLSKEVDRAMGDKERLRNKVAELKLKKHTAEEDRLGSFRKIAEYFRTPGASVPFHEAETRIRSMYKQAGEVVMDAVWESLGNWKRHEKRGSDSERTLMIETDKAPYSYILDAFEATNKVASANLELKKAEAELEEYTGRYKNTLDSLYKTSGDNTLYIKADDDEEDTEAIECDADEKVDIAVQDEDSNASGDSGVDEASEQYVIEVVTTEVKAAGEQDKGKDKEEPSKKTPWSLFKNPFSDITNMTGRENKEPAPPPVRQETLGLFKDFPDNEIEAMTSDFISDVRHMSSGHVLQDLMTYDSVISEYDPEEVLNVYNEVVRIAPQISNQPAALRGYLRKQLESSHDPRGRALETFEVTQLGGMPRPAIEPVGGEI